MLAGALDGCVEAIGLGLCLRAHAVRLAQDFTRLRHAGPPFGLSRGCALFLLFAAVAGHQQHARMRERGGVLWIRSQTAWRCVRGDARLARPKAPIIGERFVVRGHRSAPRFFSARPRPVAA